MGRGTRGRKWLSSKEINGNLYMTVVYKMSLVPVPITLMPLRVATLIAPCIEKRITSSSSLYLKWPNDVLIDNEKVCGILIEIEDNSVLVGIGCNVLEAPKVDSNGAEGGRASTSISKHNQNIMNINNNDNNISTNSDSKVESLSTSDPPLLGLAVDIVEAIDEWLQNEDTASSVLKDFEDKMTPVAQRVRTDRLVDESLLGKEILPLRLNSDGSLVVRVLDDNRETTLVADYLW
jgi:biotin-(acetyl-CoA carboxylase) ligase